MINADPSVPARNSGVALPIESGPNVRVNRDMLVGNIHEVPKPEIIAPSNKIP